MYKGVWEYNLPSQVINELTKISIFTARESHWNILQYKKCFYSLSLKPQKTNRGI